MDRRELLKMIAVLTGGAVVGAEVFLTGCKNPETTSGLAFSEDDIPYLDEIAETILPATSTPGAKAAKVGQFMTVIVNDCYAEGDQKTFHEGMKQLNDACDKKYSSSFMKATPQQRHDLLVGLDKEAKDYQKKRSESMEKAGQKDKMPNHYFSLMKQLTLWGYFTSKEGMTKALRYNPVPGHYDGCIDYKKGEKSFAGLGG
ncbi:MAG TPA: gluconate 2-dehydrogenase subunit 3 family protein [Chitinophagaceae bacterium]|nr:gluconate 2-dehydrogenase subunit 3 family protein [Chitinophagaceae bacterium]